MARYMASNSRPNALYLISRGWKRGEKNARGDQRPLCRCCSAAAWSDASTTRVAQQGRVSQCFFHFVKSINRILRQFQFIRCQQRGSSLYEAAIEIHTTEELAEFVHGRRLTESAYRFDFFCQRLNALAADLEPEELKVWREKNAFCRVQLDAVLFKPLKKSSKHVVQIDEAESQPSSHFVHEALECLSSISQTERHPHVFKKAERCRDGRLWNIFIRHRDLLIGADQVNFGEDRPAAQLCDEVIDVGYRVSVGLRHVVEASIISTWAPGVWLFLWDHVKR
ncbi:hypothetical protein T02_15237 [Trichinella nativa]|uniref:Uncharacterized protein n=1 Tax=Trichinella nativa TaxID=6335 RepID=A0A0V1LLP6_9BILA|nr:hypothetical protein T02_15237 [Trichinella nativa]